MTTKKREAALLLFRFGLDEDNAAFRSSFEAAATPRFDTKVITHRFWDRYLAFARHGRYFLTPVILLRK
jgi:hypothetical protein